MRKATAFFVVFFPFFFGSFLGGWDLVGLVWGGFWVVCFYLLWAFLVCLGFLHVHTLLLFFKVF